MDIRAINQTSFGQMGAHHAKAAADVPKTQKSENVSQPVKISSAAKVELQQTDTKRLEMMRSAAREALKSTYAVSDKSFSIFKDTRGEYITRVTSLRDGSVTYLPEPELLRQMELSGVDTSRLKLNA